MSLENHPNFHAVKFTADITSSYFECLRGCAGKKNAPEIMAEVVEFVANIESMVDEVEE